LFLYLVLFGPCCLLSAVGCGLQPDPWDGMESEDLLLFAFVHAVVLTSALS
jgi:hypothetical protein